MALSIILTLVGPDRPGLVEAVSGLVVTHGGNWLESRLARLGGQFAGVARVSIPDGHEAGLRVALAQLGASGLGVTVAADPADAAPPTGQGTRLRLELLGQDRPGIVSQISKILAAHRANVEDLASTVESAAMSGDTLFRCVVELTLPPGVAVEVVRSELERLAADLMVDVSLRSAR